MRGDSDLAFDWRPATGAAVFSAGFNCEGFADSDLDFALDGLELDKIAAARAEGAARPPPGDLARLKSFLLIIDDDAMLDAFFALTALESGGSAEDLRKTAPAFIRLASGEALQASSGLGEVVAALADFIEEGGVLTIGAKAATPLPLGALASPSAADALNLTATHQP